LDPSSPAWFLKDPLDPWNPWTPSVPLQPSFPSCPSDLFLQLRRVPSFPWDLLCLSLLSLPSVLWLQTTWAFLLRLSLPSVPSSLRIPWVPLRHPLRQVQSVQWVLQQGVLVHLLVPWVLWILSVPKDQTDLSFPSPRPSSRDLWVPLPPKEMDRTVPQVQRVPSLQEWHREELYMHLMYGESTM